MQPLSAGSSHQHAQTGSGLGPNLGTGPRGQAHGAAAAASAPLQLSADQLLRVLANHALPKAERQTQGKGQGGTGVEAPAGLCGRMPLHDAAMSCQVQAPCYNCHCQGLMPSPCCTVYCRHTQLWAAAAQVRSLAQSNAAGLEVVLAASSRVRKYAAAMKPQPMSMEQAWDLQVSCSTGLQLPLAGNKIDSD